jgi:hypothetical protein
MSAFENNGYNFYSRQLDRKISQHHFDLIFSIKKNDLQIERAEQTYLRGN